jgi:putative ABC transport system substrate-binding protein
MRRGYSTLAQNGDAGLLVGPDAFFYGRRDQLISLASKWSVPAIYEWREFIDRGG